MTSSEIIKGFVDHLIEQSLAESMDRVYLTNQVLRIINLDEFDTHAQACELPLLSLMDKLVKLGLANQSDEALVTGDMLGAELMGLFLPLPSTFNRIFWDRYQHNPRTATLYFYQMSRLVNYIKTREISKNIAFPFDSKYGQLEITINLSKPEKDPKAIALAQNNKEIDYPQCQLCLENEGFVGRINYAARSNHRVIRLTLGDEDWGFQYSPYAYFPEHAIVFAKEHRPMLINAKNIQRLFEFVELFPQYFVGSNADLPIVGGSILTHDHFQAGNYEMPMAKAEIETQITIPGMKLAQAGILNWPMSVIRLSDASITNLVKATDLIMQNWQHYSDESVDIKAYDVNGIRHHTITPIVRKRNNLYEIDIVLRDNNTSAKYPDGIFHPHKDVQHIKKENIGLIEVMGLAILPPRLQEEMQAVEDYVLGNENNIAAIHQQWADKIKGKHPELKPDNVTKIVQNEIGLVFERVLSDAGVFKRDTLGKAAFIKFIDSLHA